MSESSWRDADSRGPQLQAPCSWWGPPLQSYPWQATDRETPAATMRVFAYEATHDLLPGDRGGEPLVAEQDLPAHGAGARPCRRCGAGQTPSRTSRWPSLPSSLRIDLWQTSSTISMSPRNGPNLSHHPLVLQIMGLPCLYLVLELKNWSFHQK